ncbi:MAG: ATP synthase F1 subunit gamma [Puniceicoccales bacterium]|jgi:F-type H+-transporting ATPase subunit gamma|nr:ATP synthase F1 subunit gamma [Puniceicoccales bacterium]
MKGVREIKRRMRAVANTAKITRAMQLVASSKMKKAQRIAVSGRQYILALSEIVDCLASANGKYIKHPFFKKREIKHRGVLIIGTEKGLCGSLNQGLVKKIITDFSAGNEKFVTIGKKASQFVSKLRRDLLADFSVSDRVELCELRPVIEFLKNAYLRGEVDSIEVVYSRSVNPLTHEQVCNKVLPMLNLSAEISSLKKRMHISEEGNAADSREVIFEPNVQAIVDKLSHMFFSQSIFRDVLEAKAAEHSARMFAMKNATDNADSLSKNLAMEYNKARQAKITNEIIEIAAAANG